MMMTMMNFYFNQAVNKSLPADHQNPDKASLVCPIYMTPTGGIPAHATCRKQTHCDKCDETLDEITWGCDESHTSLTENTKNCHDQVGAPSEEGNSNEKSSPHFYIQKEKSVNAQEVINPNIVDQKEVASRSSKQEHKKHSAKNEVKNKEKLEAATSKHFVRGKSVNSKKRSGRMKQKEKKVSRGVNTNTAERTAKAFSDQQMQTSPTDLVTVAEGGKATQNAAKLKKVKKKVMISPKAVEIGKNSDDSNSLDGENDPEVGCSDQQFLGNRSESSLVCKRDSWIWFSPEMRPSVENFAARQRKFKSRDPRVAELAVEISRQEELNRDIERAAESLIDSSSTSTYKLQDISNRIICKGGLHKGRCGAIKSRVARKARVAPYILPDKRKVISSKSALSLAYNDCIRINKNEFGDEPSTVKILPLYEAKKALPKKQEGHFWSTTTPPHKHKKVHQNHLDQPASNADYFIKDKEQRVMSSTSLEDFRHNVPNNSSFINSSLTHPLCWYNSPAAKIVGQPVTFSRYSPLYDNTTLISSTQCSLCSMESSLESMKAVNNIHRLNSSGTEMADENKQNICSRQHSPIALSHCPGKTNLQKESPAGSDTRSFSPQRTRQSVTPERTRDTADSYPELHFIMPEKTLEKQSPVRRSSRSPEKISPRKRCFSDRMGSGFNRIASEVRLDGMKAMRKSPQLNFSTGESESDSMYRDKSGGVDASYRQCMISKEVNTAVQRLLFDTEKSSSSHSPSSKSRIRLPEVNSDEECHRYYDFDYRRLKNTTHLPESFTSERAQNSPSNLRPEIERDKHKDDGGKDSPCRQQNMDTPGQQNSCQTDSHSSSHKISHKCTNIYARDYYLGKRLRWKKQLDSKANVCMSRWKKSDAALSKPISLRLYSSPDKSKLPAVKKEVVRFTKDRIKCRQPFKLVSCLARQPVQARTSARERCLVAKARSKSHAHCVLTRNLRDLNCNDSKCHEINACSDHHESGEQGVGIMKTMTFKQSKEPSNSDPHATKSSFQNPVSQNDCAARNEDKLSPVAPSCHTSQTATQAADDVDQSKKEAGTCLESAKLLVIGSTNNSSSNLSYSSDKSECSRKHNTFNRSAQFYFVTQSKLINEQPNSETTTNECFRNEKKTHLDSTEILQKSINSAEYCALTKPHSLLESCHLKGDSSSRIQDSASKESVTDVMKPVHIINTDIGNLDASTLASLPEMNMKLRIGHDCIADTKHTKYKQSQDAILRMEDSKNFQASKLQMQLNSNIQMDVPMLMPFFFSGKEEKWQDKFQTKEASFKAEGLRQGESRTSGNGQLGYSVLSTSVKNISNPDSGYDESLSERANIDSSFQLSVTTPADTFKSGSRMQQANMDINNIEKFERAHESISPESNASHSSDLAHRSKISNECDSEQDTLPSLSDDGCHLSHNKPPEKCKVGSTTGEFPCREGNTFENDEVGIERRSCINSSREILNVTQNKDSFFTSFIDSRPVSKCGTGTGPTEFDKTLNWLLPATLTRECEKPEAQCASKKAAGWISHDFGGAITTPGFYIPGTSQSHTNSFKASSLEEETSAYQTSFMLYSDTTKYIPEFPATESTIPFYNSPYKPHRGKLSEMNLIQSKEDGENYWYGTTNNNRVDYLTPSSTSSPYYSEDNFQTTSSVISMSTNMDADQSSLKEAANDLLFSVSEDSVFQESSPVSESSKLSLSQTSFSNSADVESEFAHCITLPPTSSDEEDGDVSDYQRKVTAHEISSQSVGYSLNEHRRRVLLSPLSGTGSCMLQTRTSHTTDSPVTKSQFPPCTESSTSCTSQLKNKIIISARSMPFSEILKRF